MKMNSKQNGKDLSQNTVEDTKLVEQAFSERKHEAIRNAFFQNGVYRLNEVTPELLSKIKYEKGIGKLKREEIDRVLKSAGYKDTWADKIIYPEIIASSPKLREIFKEKKLNVVPLSISAKELFGFRSRIWTHFMYNLSD